MKNRYRKLEGNIYKKLDADGYPQPGTYTFYPANRTMVKNK